MCEARASIVSPRVEWGGAERQHGVIDNRQPMEQSATALRGFLAASESRDDNQYTSLPSPIIASCGSRSRVPIRHPRSESASPLL